MVTAELAPSCPRASAAAVSPKSAGAPTAPVTVGWKSTPIVVEPPAGTCTGRPTVTAKAPASDPTTRAEEMATGSVPGFWISASIVDDEPTPTVPKSRLAGAVSVPVGAVGRLQELNSNATVQLSSGLPPCAPEPAAA